MNKKELKEKVSKIVESKNFKKAIYAFGIIVVLVLVFQAGMIAGFKKASFSRDWGDNYERNFGPRREGPAFFKDNFKDMPNAHGAIGKIIKVEYPNIVVLDKDQTEKVVIVKEDTSILERREVLTKDSLVVDKFIVVIGNPNSLGQIEAKLIRIMPSPGEMMMNNISDINTKNQ